MLVNSHINRGRGAFEATNVQNVHHQHQIPNSLLQHLCTPVTFCVFQPLGIHWRFSNVNCNNTILFYTCYCQLAECISKATHICHLALFYYITAEYYNSIYIYIWVTTIQNVYRRFRNTLYRYIFSVLIRRSVLFSKVKLAMCHVLGSTVSNHNTVASLTRYPVCVLTVGLPTWQEISSGRWVLDSLTVFPRRPNQCLELSAQWDT
jgi:hypothetical protein